MGSVWREVSLPMTTLESTTAKLYTTHHYLEQYLFEHLDIHGSWKLVQTTFRW